MSSRASEPRLGLENKCLDSSSNIIKYDTIVGLIGWMNDEVNEWLMDWIYKVINLLLNRRLIGLLMNRLMDWMFTINWFVNREINGTYDLNRSINFTDR